MSTLKLSDKTVTVSTVTVDSVAGDKLDDFLVAQCSMSVRHRRRVELRVVRHLLCEAYKAGFTHCVVDDGEMPGGVLCADNDAAVREVFAVDECRIIFRTAKGQPSRWVQIVLGIGNGWNTISDYSSPSDTSDGFAAMMDRVLDWCNEQEEQGR